MEINQGLNLIKIKLFSQDRWREVRNDLREEEGTGAKIHRNVPGWKLSWTLFDKLLLGFCFVHRSHPLGLRLTVSPGMEYRLGTGGMASEVPESSIQRWTLETGLLLKTGPNSDLVLETWKKELYASLLRPPKQREKLISGFADPSEKESPWIDSKWWAASSWTFSQEGETHHRGFRNH
jgi:hypothetical protein